MRVTPKRIVVPKGGFEPPQVLPHTPGQFYLVEAEDVLEDDDPAMLHYHEERRRWARERPPR